MRLIDADALDKRIYEEIPIKEFGTVKRMARMREIIGEAPTVGGWISVKDRMPPNDDTKVMTYGNPVTHWMPLPEPPKEEVDNEY